MTYRTAETKVAYTATRAGGLRRFQNQAAHAAVSRHITARGGTSGHRDRGHGPFAPQRYCLKGSRHSCFRRKFRNLR